MKDILAKRKQLKYVRGQVAYRLDGLQLIV